ncbi:MAG: GNAT family N-acetyltransferase [Hyphomicrobiaceae bacterium]|nr:GNAT family N-acetyltransferase [Hyphomicrobiaceae bacterium]
MGITYRLLEQGDEAVLLNIADGVFDNSVDPDRARAYLAEPRYEMAVALDGDRVVGMASGFSYFHPDKPDEFFVNECGVADAYLRKGIATELMNLLLSHARALGCAYCWLGTEIENIAANGLYTSLGGKASTFVLYEWE